MAAALALLATGVFGETIAGVARWVRVGVVVPPSFVLLPAMLFGFARLRDPLSSATMMIAALTIRRPSLATAGAR